MPAAPENVGGVPDDPGVAVPSDRAIPSALDTVETAVSTLAVDVLLPSGLPGPDVTAGTPASAATEGITPSKPGAIIHKLSGGRPRY